MKHTRSRPYPNWIPSPRRREQTADQNTKEALARFEVEGLRSFFPRSDQEFNFIAFAQIFKIYFRGSFRTVKNDFIIPASGVIKPKPLSLMIFLIVPVIRISLRLHEKRPNPFCQAKLSTACAAHLFGVGFIVL